MKEDDSVVEGLLRDATRGNEAASAELFNMYRDRLRRMVRFRLDRRLQGRVDASDILQDAYLDMAAKLPEYAEKPGIPFFLWLRLVVGERLLRVHRSHLGTAMRDAGREISIHRGALPEASSVSLAARLLGQFTSASRAVIRSEMQVLLQGVLNGMDAIDREVIALRHFEELSNEEVAETLGLSKAAASKRYVRAMVRLKSAVDNTPGLTDASREGANS